MTVRYFIDPYSMKFDLHQSHDKKKHDENNQETISRLKELVKKLEEKKKPVS